MTIPEELTMTDDRLFMQAALDEAELALAKGEVPIGAVIVLDGAIVGRGHNLRETSNDPTTHAEMVAIRQAAESIGHWRLLETTLGGNDSRPHPALGLRLPRPARRGQRFDLRLFPGRALQPPGGGD